jgi:hypothetical protein
MTYIRTAPSSPRGVASAEIAIVTRVSSSIWTTALLDSGVVAVQVAVSGVALDECGTAGNFAGASGAAVGLSG